MDSIPTEQRECHPEINYFSNLLLSVSPAMRLTRTQTVEDEAVERRFAESSNFIVFSGCP